MHTFVFSSSVSSTFSWSGCEAKYDVLLSLDESIYSLSYIYQHCGSFSGSWNQLFLLHQLHPFSSCHFFILVTLACFNRECTLVSQRIFSQPILFHPGVYLKLVSAIFYYFYKKNVFVCYFKWSTLKRNLTYTCFFFPSFHEHSFSLELLRAVCLLKTYFEK